MPILAAEQLFGNRILSGEGAVSKFAAPPCRERVAAVPVKHSCRAVAVVACLEDAQGVRRLVELHWQLGVQQHAPLVAPAVEDEQVLQTQRQAMQHERPHEAAEPCRVLYVRD